MKKLCSLMVILLISIAAPAWALPDSIVQDVDILSESLTDVNPLYWGKKTLEDQDRNTEGTYDAGTAMWDGGNDQLNNSDAVTEQYWLAALLGLAAPDNTVGFQGRVIIGGNSQNAYDPIFGWEYAVVKWDGYWTAYIDDGDGLLTVPTVGTYKKAISHISFFGEGGEVLPPVPEPATMLLLGSGLVGLAGLGRKKLRKK